MDYLNKIELRGNVGNEPREKMVGNMKVVNFSLATIYSYNKKNGESVQETTWHNVTVWGDFSIKKGDIIEVIGRIRNRKYTDQNGVEKNFSEVLAQEVKILKR
jgi:single-strand DNA-binding protein